MTHNELRDLEDLLFAFESGMNYDLLTIEQIRSFQVIKKMIKEEVNKGVLNFIVDRDMVQD